MTRPEQLREWTKQFAIRQRLDLLIGDAACAGQSREDGRGRATELHPEALNIAAVVIQGTSSGAEGGW